MKILVAEKDAGQRGLIASRLRVRGYEVFEASESHEALVFLNRDRMDLILISDRMSRLGSLHLIEAIRRRPHLTAVPVILLTEETNIAQLVMSRERGYDDFLIYPFDPLELQLRVAIAIERTRHRSEANALTHLPGNHAIEKVIKKRIEKKEKFSVLYIDINNFKSFNDYYSFEQGDDVIRQTAHMLLKTVDQMIHKNECFIGHIGGDDFVVVLNPEDEEKFAKLFIAVFDQIIPTYYDEEDRARGAIRVKNRRGKMENFPLMSCSVSACNNLYKNYTCLGEVARDAMEIKAYLKTQPGSRYLRDRRVEPTQKIEAEPPPLELPEDFVQDEEVLLPLGQILLKNKLITSEQLSQALKKHLHTGQKLGQVLIGMQAVSGEEIGKILEKKLKVPYFPLKRFIPSQDLSELLPSNYLKLHGVFPIQKMEEKLKLGMCSPQDRQTLDAIAHLTHLKPLPYLILEDELEELLARNDRQSPSYFHDKAE